MSPSPDSVPSVASAAGRRPGRAWYRGLLLASCLLLGAVCAQPAGAAEVEFHDDFQGYKAGSSGAPAWQPQSKTWVMRDGVYEQTDASLPGTVAYLRDPVFGDAAVSVWFRVLEGGTGVKAPGIVFRSASAGEEYWAHFDTAHQQLLLQRQVSPTPGSERDIKRCGLKITPGEWHEARVECLGKRITVSLDGRVVLEAEDETFTAGKVGLRAGQGRVQFDDFRVMGARGKLGKEWKMTALANRKYQVICKDAGAGGYQAFPDLVRLKNGDLLCVFYAGYQHVSLPCEALPRGARVSAVRSTDGGKTWGRALTVADTPWDDRDPHVCQLSDGTVICNWFTYYAGSATKRPGEGTRYKEIWLARSTDGGKTWGEPELIPSTADDYYGVGGPIRELPSGTLIMPIYRELPDPLRVWSAMILSEDGGKTWSKPYLVDADNDDNDEPDVIAQPDGSILCVMRSNRGENVMWKSLSRDGGKTWSKCESVGYPGHAPYLLRTREGVLLCAHRLPGTSLHFSLDDGRTWSDNYVLDTVGGAYPSLVEMPDGRILAVYYEEGPGSAIRAQFFRATRGGIQFEEAAD